MEIRKKKHPTSNATLCVAIRLSGSQFIMTSLFFLFLSLPWQQCRSSIVHKIRLGYFPPSLSKLHLYLSLASYLPSSFSRSIICAMAIQIFQNYPSILPSLLQLNYFLSFRFLGDQFDSTAVKLQVSKSLSQSSISLLLMLS